MKIGTKLLLILVLIGLVPLGIVGVWSYFRTSDALTKDSLAHLQSVSVIQRNRVERIIEQNVERIGLVTSRTSLISGLKNYITTSNTSDQDAMSRTLGYIRLSIGDFVKMSVITLDGKVVASTDAAIIGTHQYSANEAFVRGQSNTVDDILFRSEEKDLHLYLSGPIRLDNELLGVLLVEADGGDIISITEDYSGLGQTGETDLAKRNANGDALYIAPLRFDVGASLTRIVPKDNLDSPMTQALLKKQGLFVDAIDYRGMPVFAATQYIADTDWGLVSKIDKAEVLAPIINLRDSLVAIASLALALILLLALYLARSITKPIVGLSKVAAKIREGDFSQRAETKSKDEIGMLSQSFNLMTESLTATNNSLEQKVTELEETRERLEREITEHKQAEERIVHLSNVLRAIRNVNQLITREKDRERLIQKSCDLLVQRKGYNKAWIVLLDEKKNFVTAASAGLGKDAVAFLKQLETGDYPVCVMELLAQEQPFLTYDQPGKRHQGCVLAAAHSGVGVFRCKLEHEGKLYGVIGTTVPTEAVSDKEEQNLLLELCGDIGFALANIEGEERRKHAEESLQKAEQNFRGSLDSSPLGIRIVSAEGELLYANQAILDIYGYDSIEELKTIPRKKSYTAESYAEHQVRKEKRQRGEYVPSNYEVSIVRKNGEIRHLKAFRKEVNWNGELQFQTVYEDISEQKRAEEQTRELKEYLQMQVERMPIALIVWDTEFRVQTWNPSAERIFGFTAEEALGKHPYDIIVPKEAQPHVDTIWSRLLAGDMTAYSVNENITKDGRTIVCDWTNTPLKKDNGAVLGVLSMVQDITERKRAEIEIKREKAFSANIVATVPESLLVVDRDSRIKSTNRAFNELFQTEPEKVMGKKIADVLGDKDGKLSAQLARLFGTEDTLEDFELHYQSEKLGERILNITARGMIVAEEEEEEEEEEEQLVVIRDITERKQMEEEVKRSNSFFKAVFNSTSDAVLVIDVHDFTIVRANDAFLQQYGLKEEQIIGKTCYQITHHRSDPCTPPEDICPLRDTVTTGQHSAAEHVHYTKDNERVYVEVSTSPIKDEGGKVIQVVHVSRDLTERKKMQEQLMAQDRLASIGQLVSGVAHEINNPLTGVIGFSELLLKRDLPDDIKADLKIVNDEAVRTSRIVKNLLTFARKQPEGKALVDINEQIQRVLDLRQHEQSVNNIKVITRFASDLSQVMGNASQLQQVFFNIVINAEFFMLEAHQKGNLTITTERIGDFVRCSFTDDGPGIAEGHKRNLFTPFFTTKEVGKGTGLGLSICYGIITEHGGKIYAESEPGKGATFIVELPVKEVAT